MAQFLSSSMGACRVLVGPTAMPTLGFKYCSAMVISSFAASSLAYMTTIRGLA